MGRRIARQHPGMKGDTRPGNALHERHRGIAVEIRFVPFLLLDDAEKAGRCRMALHARRNRRTRDRRAIVIHGHVLAADRNRDDQRPGKLWRLHLRFGGIRRLRADAERCAAPGRVPLTCAGVP